MSEHRVDIVVASNSFSIICDDQQIAEIGASRDGLHIAVLEDAKFHLVNGDEIPDNDVDVAVRGVHRVTGLNARRPGAARSYSPSRHDASDESEVNEVLRLIEESYRLHPEQTKAFTASETRRIAKEVYGSEDEKYRVAGVRAALSRGVYTLGAKT